MSLKKAKVLIVSNQFSLLGCSSRISNILYKDDFWFAYSQYLLISLFDIFIISSILKYFCSQNLNNRTFKNVLINFVSNKENTDHVFCYHRQQYMWRSITHQKQQEQSLYQVSLHKQNKKTSVKSHITPIKRIFRSTVQQYVGERTLLYKEIP